MNQSVHPCSSCKQMVRNCATFSREALNYKVYVSYGRLIERKKKLPENFVAVGVLKGYRALKSHALSVSLTHFHVISLSHTGTSIPHALALSRKLTLLFWPSEVLIIVNFLPQKEKMCLVLIN